LGNLSTSDGLALVGVGFVAIGVGMVSVPAAVVFLGLAMIGWALLLARPGD
jgi:hypothetical protein